MKLKKKIKSRKERKKMKIEREGKFLYGKDNNYCYCIYRGITGKMQYSVCDNKAEHFVAMTPAMSQILRMLEGIY
jgi:hypothetical protein